MTSRKALSSDALAAVFGGLAVHRPTDLVRAGDAPDFVVVDGGEQQPQLHQALAGAPGLGVPNQSQSPLSLIQGLLGSLRPLGSLGSLPSGSNGTASGQQPSRIVGADPQTEREGEPQEEGMSFTFDRETQTFSVVDQPSSMPNLRMNDPSFGNFALDSYDLGASQPNQQQAAPLVATQGIADEAGFAEMPIDNSTSADGTAF